MAKISPKLGKILKHLIYTKGINASEVAKQLNIPPPTLSRLITGKTTRTNYTLLKNIADFFSVSYEQLNGDQPLPNYSLNLEQLGFEHSTSCIPLIEWEDIEKEHTNYIRKITTESKVSSKAFCLMMKDTSMEPLFPENTILIFDPEKKAVDRSYIIAKIIDSNSYIFRQLLVDNDNQFLKPVNPDSNYFSIRLLNAKDKIIATLVEARHVY